MSPTQGRKRKSDPIQAATQGADSSPTSESKRQKNLPVRAKDDEPAAALAGAPTKNTHITFGDDDDADAAAITAALSKKPAPATVEEIPDSESDDDDAPEAVSTQKAAEDVKKSAQAVQKAAQEQAAMQKRKRQEKDAFFKQQAKERKKTEPVPVTTEETEEDSAAARRQPDLTGGRRRQEKLNIPNLLPAEFLTDSSSEDEEEEASGVSPRPKKRKISGIERRLSRQDRPAHDEKIGSTLYRVTKKTDERMAPKLKKYSSSTRDALLKRNRSAVKPRAGFFKK